MLTVLIVAVILGCGGIAKAPKDKEAAPAENRKGDFERSEFWEVHFEDAVLEPRSALSQPA